MAYNAPGSARKDTEECFSHRYSLNKIELSNKIFDDMCTEMGISYISVTMAYVLALERPVFHIA